jgi:hypothetical protein
LIDLLQLLRINMLLVCKVLSKGIMVCINIFKLMGVNCINWYLNHNLLQHTHEYFGVHFISFKNILIGESYFVIIFLTF